VATSVLVMSVFIVDATMTLVTRVLYGERWYTAHNQHVYQRLIAHGWSHRLVLIAYQAINVILVLPAVGMAELYPQYAMVITVLTMLTLVSGWLIINRRIGMRASGQLK